MTLHDAVCKAAIDRSVNMLVPWYLIASYGYYHCDDPVITDGLFDTICKKLNDNWDIVEHVHKNLVNRVSLKAGTCLIDWVRVPSIIKSSARRLQEKPK